MYHRVPHEEDRDALKLLLSMRHSPRDIPHLVLPTRLSICAVLALVSLRVLGG